MSVTAVDRQSRCTVRHSERAVNWDLHSLGLCLNAHQLCKYKQRA